MTPFGSLLTAMITPFDENGAVDYGKAWNLARYLVERGGSDGIVVAGTTGESPTLSVEEKVGLFRTVVEAVGEKARVVAGTGTYDTRESIDLTERAAAAGCHGVMAVTPYYSRPPQEGIYRHFVAIADATDLPVLLYNIPGRTARRIEIETLVRLAGHPRIVAVKDAVDDIVFSGRQLAALPDDFAVYSGSDEITLALLALGGVGVVSVASHVAGPQIKRMLNAATEKDWETARSLHYALLPLFRALFLEPNPMPVKAAVDDLWEPVGPPRSPLVPAGADTLEAIRAALAIAQRA